MSSWIDNSTSHATLWHDGAVEDIGVIKGNSSAVLAINDRGVAVGVSTYGDSGLWTAAIWHDGVVEDLNQITSSPPGTHLEMAFAINNKGEMLVTGRQGFSSYQFLLVPQGQPRKQKSR